MFLPNQKVVCIDGRFPLGIEKLYHELPKEGTTYTIRDIVPGVGLTGEEGEVAPSVYPYPAERRLRPSS